MKKIKWAVIGAGNIAHQFVSELIKLPNCSVVGVASRTKASAGAFAEKFNITDVYESYEMLVNHCDVDIVYIASPHQLHFEQALSCLNAGKAVLCEKPMTLNVGQSMQLIQLAEQKNLFLMEAMITPLLPAIKGLQAYIEQGKLGEVKSIQASMGFQAELDINSRIFNPKLAGGALLDVGIYPLTLAQLLMKKMPSSMVSQVEKAQTGVDQQSIVSLKYESEQGADVLVQCQSSVVNFLPCCATIYGDKLIAQLADFSWSGRQIVFTNHQGERVEVLDYASDENAYALEAIHVNHCLQNGLIESPLIPHQQTLAVLHIMDSLRQQWGLVYPDE
ncbi:hypothetical protein CW745_00345 [Psychromonas sp. psych-6C06]|uniref:Gfo/Idh/MocA family protein n=1 Tax=Psychromonas sp. psych-6C06 TaxID=2058089 RepID=UPI000C33151B|nr:Gfo/Idh/MocA family oxidoreductase [Psychromonas sp. psych-6C06]PKF63340.1 hypothetical protein CW745_00345 [Psychromonas sp. psych-6C06]